MAYCHVKKTMSIVVEKSKSNQNRLNVRLGPDLKARVTRAAYILGQDLTEFATATLNERATEVIERHEAFVLTESQRQFFFDYLAGKIDREPSERSKRVAKEYKKGRKSDEKYELLD